VQLDHYLRADLPGVARTARDLEALGIDGLYTAEGPHEPFFPLALAAEHTSRALLFTNIAVAFARNPMDVAQASNDLQTLSRGRFALGLGTQIRPHIQNRFSMPWSRPAARMREFVRAIKAVHRAWNERVPLRFEGELYRHTLMTPFFDPGPNPYGAPPVWVAGLGPRMTAVAGEVGDGLLVHPFHTARFVEQHTVPALAEGLARAGRTRSDVTVSATPIVCTGTTDAEMEQALAGVRRLLAFYGSTPAYRVSLEPHGWGNLQGELNALTKQGRWDETLALVDDELLDTFAVRGAPGDIGHLVATRYQGAVDRVGLSMPYEASRDTLAAVVAGFRNA
jgi:probable F420-dependent oxidoreductase